MRDADYLVEHRIRLIEFFVSEGDIDKVMGNHKSGSLGFRKKTDCLLSENNVGYSMDVNDSLRAAVTQYSGEFTRRKKIQVAMKAKNMNIESFISEYVD